MTTPAYSIVFWAVPYGTLTTVVRGNVMIPISGSAVWEVATTANRGTRRAEAIALTSFDSSNGPIVGTVELQQTGTIDATISGLAAGSASWVRCSATGTIERCTPASGDDIIGYAEADGRVHLAFGTWTAEIIAGGGTFTVPGSSTEFLYRVDASTLGAMRQTYVNATGEIRAEGDLFQTVDNEAGTDQLCVWSRGSDTGDPLFGDYDYLNIGADLAGTKIPKVLYLSGQKAVSFSTTGVDYGLISVLEATGSSTGVGALALPNFAIVAHGQAFSATSLLGGGTGVFAITHASVEPSNDPTAANVLWVKSADGRWYTRRPSGGAASKIVEEATTDTLTNKTVVLASNTITDSGAAAGGVPVHNGTRYVNQAKGADGTFLGVSGGVVGYYTPASGGTGAPTDATYVTLSTNGTLTNERVLTAGTGISLTDGGAGGNLTVACTVTATAPAGSSTYVQWNNAGAFGADSSFTYASGVATLSTAVQLPAVRRSSSQYFLDSDGTTMWLFGDSGYGNQPTNGRIYTTSALYLGVSGSQNCITINTVETAVKARAASAGLNLTTTNVEVALPLAGYSGGPLKAKSTSVAIAIGAFSPADLSCPIVVLTGTTLAGSGYLELANTPDAIYWVYNLTSTTIGVRRVGSSSTVVDILSGKSGMFWHNGTDYLPLGCPNGGS